MNCPICHNKTASYICRSCGTDISCLLTVYPTLSPCKKKPATARLSGEKKPTPVPQPPKMDTKRRQIISVLLAVVVIMVIVIIALVCNSGNGKPSADRLYLELIEDYEQRYGELSYPTQEEMDASDGAIWCCNPRGLCYADLYDFNDDGSDELLLAYNFDSQGLIIESYNVEVWSYNNGRISCVYESAPFVEGIDGMELLYGEINGQRCIAECNRGTDWNISFAVFNGNRFVSKLQPEYAISGDLVYEILYSREGFIDFYKSDDGVNFVSLVNSDYSNLSSCISDVKRSLS